MIYVICNMVYDIWHMLKKMSLFSPCRRSQNPTQKSEPKKWAKKVGTRLSVQVSLTFIQTLTRSIDPGSAAVSLWLSRHLDSHDSHGSERLWSIASWCVSIGWTAATGTAHLVSERDPVRMLTQRRPMSWWVMMCVSVVCSSPHSAGVAPAEFQETCKDKLVGCGHQRAKPINTGTCSTRRLF